MQVTELGPYQSFDTGSWMVKIGEIVKRANNRKGRHTFDEIIGWL